MSHIHRKAIMRIGIEIACLAVVSLGFVVCEKLFIGYQFKYDGILRYRLYDIAVSCLPVLFLYVLGRVLFTSVTSACVVAVLTVGVSYASYVKSSLTGEPLSWTDVSGTANISVVSHYVSVQFLLVAAILAAASLVLFARYEFPVILGRIKRHRGLYGLAASFLLPFLIMSDGKTAANAASHASVVLFDSLGSGYNPFEWPKNIRKNGLGVHLIQTSLRHMPSDPTEDEIDRFEKLAAVDLPHPERPRTVVMILCESCWHDETRFKDVFDPLVTRGFTAFRSVSPNYGGGTVNSAFEIITGLPARSSVLTGVIYQEYASVISEQAFTPPRYLRNDGFHTVAMHNNLGRFWYRDIVSPKMGYQEFHDIEDMGVQYTTEWADDSILFNSALRELKSSADKPVFMHLTTVFTHGRYDRRGDLGEGHYREKLVQSITSMASFIDKVYDHDPDALVMVYGDHKPTLTTYFIREGVFSPSYFKVTGDVDTEYRFADDAPRHIVGDMPIWVKGPDQERVRDFVSKADKHPLFCISTYFNEVFLSSEVPAFTFGKPVCDDYAELGYSDTVSRYPPWLFTESILE